MQNELDHLLSDVLGERQREDLLRRRRTVRPLSATRLEIDGRSFINFASNNYLGLTHHPGLIAATDMAMRDAGAGSGAAGLISGYTTHHARAEAAITAWKGTESAVLLPSGYQANLAAVQTLAAGAEAAHRPIRFLIDKLVHASLIDAVRASGAPFRVFPHNGLDKLERLLASADRGELQVVVTESIFSMDGDAADLAGLAQLKQRHPIILLLDEAHGSGVYGANGSGYATECGLAHAVDVCVVTLSKGLGLSGGAVCGSRAFCEALVNLGRAYIYSTSIPPATAAAACAALDVMREEAHRQQRVRELARRVRSDLQTRGFHVPPGDAPIVPVIMGDASAALDAARRLEEQGLLVVAIRPPTVPRGASRLRITLSSEHSDEDVRELLSALSAIAPPRAQRAP